MSRFTELADGFIGNPSTELVEFLVCTGCFILGAAIWYHLYRRCNDKD